MDSTNLQCYLQGRKSLRTIKGKIINLTNELSNNTDNVTIVYKSSFIVNKIMVEFTSTQAVDANDGDEVVVAGVMTKNRIFKAFSFKNLSQ